jgi:dipeptidyl aminopeptidase/acylaminoacyl peptidase
MRRPFLRWVFTIVALAGTAHSQTPARNHDITVEDYFTQAYITACVVSPDGQNVAYTERRWEPPSEDRNTDLWVVGTRTGQTRRLTFDPAADTDPVWNSDGRLIYFLSKRGKDGDPPPLNGKTQVWRIAVEGGEPLAITRLNDGVGTFRLSRDGRTLFYTVTSKQVEDEWKALREEYTDLTYGRGAINTSQLWTLDLNQWRAEKLVDDGRVIGEFEVSPDGAKIAMITTPRQEEIWGEGFSRADVFDVAAKRTTTLDDSLWRKAAPSPYGWLQGLAWSSDSKKLAFSVDFDGYPAELLVAHWTASGIRMHRLIRPDQLSLGDASQLQWVGNAPDLCFLADQRARIRLACISGIEPGRQGAFRVLTPGDVVVEGFSLTPDGRQVVVTLGDAKNGADLYLTAVAGKSNLKWLTHINPQMDTWKLPQIQIVSWTGANGDTVEGILELPPDYQPGQKLPLHVALHGGPNDADYLHFEYWIYGRTLWPARGWAVLCPNYRGSTGYGDKFLTDLVGRENDIEIEDILKGVDALVSRGIADSEKLAVSGWSNGGFLTDGIITKTHRFKAAASGAGVLEMAMQWGTEDTPGHVVNFMRGLPWEKREAYRNASPLWSLDQVTTPTLIHVGQDDERVPAAHSRALFRALSFYRKVPCELIEYPGQGHGLAKYSHRKAKLEWELAWFDKYVLGKNPEEPAKP